MSGANEKYRLEDRLGGGGMAEVFAASTLGAEGFTRRVAIKRVLPGFSNNPKFAQMFVAEAQLSSLLVHPNIVSVLDFDRDANGRLFLVMELVEGRDLHALSATGPLPYEVIVHVIVELLRGLGYAHDLPLGGNVRGLIHRDVSPHNVLVSWDGEVKVSDFGLAKARDATEMTASTLIKGKPAYMSPEQANGQPLDARSDLFAVGVILWEMLAGRRLFIAEDTRATLAAVLFGKIPRPRHLHVEVPKDLDRIAMKLLERDLAARYPSAEAAIQDLLKGRSASAQGGQALSLVLSERYPQDAPLRRTELRPVAPQSTSHEVSTFTAALPMPGSRSPRAWRWVVVVVLLAALVAIGGYGLVRREDNPLATTTLPSDARLSKGLTRDAGIDFTYAPSCGAIVKEVERVSGCIPQATRDALHQYVNSIVVLNDRYGSLKLVEPSCHDTLKQFVDAYAGACGGGGDRNLNRAAQVDELPPKCIAYVKAFETAARCPANPEATRDALLRAASANRDSFTNAVRAASADVRRTTDDQCAIMLDYSLKSHQFDCKAADSTIP